MVLSGVLVAVYIHALGKKLEECWSSSIAQGCHMAAWKFLEGQGYGPVLAPP